MTVQFDQKSQEIAHCLVALGLFDLGPADFVLVGLDLVGLDLADLDLDLVDLGPGLAVLGLLFRSCLSTFLPKPSFQSLRGQSQTWPLQTGCKSHQQAHSVLLAPYAWHVLSSGDAGFLRAKRQ